MKQFFQSKPLFFLSIIALLFRIIFFYFGAESFYGTPNFVIGGDTMSFLSPIKNLIEHNEYSISLNHTTGAFGRLPGYPFFLAPFYSLFKSDYTQLFNAVVVIQILMDTITTIIFYKVIRKASGSIMLASISGLLYATYPFIIVWTSVAYAETLGVFLMITGVYTYINHHKSSLNLILTGALLAASFFVRPQLLFFVPAICLGIIYYSGWKSWKKWLPKGTFLLLGFLSIYSPWPIRNYVNHKKFIPFRDITAMRTWQNDVLYFHKYITAMKVGWEPQMTQLITDQAIDLPKDAYTTREDSLILMNAIVNSRNCSDGFASFRKTEPDSTICTQKTAEMWYRLFESQKKHKPFRYFITVPILNLNKGLFKTGLISNWKSPSRSKVVTIGSSLLFIYRSLLILLGLMGSWLVIRKNIVHRQLLKELIFVCICYFALWYCWLCFVTRYMEMRYFLFADILLLIPATVAIKYFHSKLIGR